MPFQIFGRLKQKIGEQRGLIRLDGSEQHKWTQIHKWIQMPANKKELRSYREYLSSSFSTGRSDRLRLDRRPCPTLNRVRIIKNDSNLRADFQLNFKFFFWRLKELRQLEEFKERPKKVWALSAQRLISTNCRTKGRERISGLFKNG